MSKVHMRAPDCSCGHHFICGNKQGPGEKRKKCDRWECVTCTKCLKLRPRKKRQGGEHFTEASLLAYQSAMKDIEWVKSLH